MSDPPRSIYLLVPAELEDDILEPLREHFAGDDSVEVIVERRSAERRDGIDDRILRSAEAARERRAQTVPRDLPPLPPELEPYAEDLRVVQRLTPVRSGLEDLEILEVVRRAQAGDADAPTEIYWRTYERVSRRLAAHLRDPDKADGAVKGAYGHIFDSLGAFDAETTALNAWLDRMVDEHAERIRAE